MIVWRCWYCTGTDTNTNSHWVLYHFMNLRIGTSTSLGTCKCELPVTPLVIEHYHCLVLSERTIHHIKMSFFRFVLEVLVWNFNARADIGSSPKFLATVLQCFNAMLAFVFLILLRCRKGKSSFYVSHYLTQVTKVVTTNCHNKMPLHNSLLQQIRAK